MIDAVAAATPARQRLHNANQFGERAQLALHDRQTHVWANGFGAPTFGVLRELKQPNGNQARSRSRERPS